MQIDRWEAFTLSLLVIYRGPGILLSVCPIATFVVQPGEKHETHGPIPECLESTVATATAEAQNCN